jgi:hypothetical protein
MTLREKQSLFARNVARLIQYLYAEGYEVTFAEAYRPPETAALYAQQGRGIADSQHTKRLAVDLNLFLDGRYLTDSDSYRIMGAYWKTLHPENVWGGDWQRKDGNHVEMRG